MKRIGLTVLSFAVPAVALAQSSINNVWDIADFIKRILDTILPLLIAAAVVYFIWGLFQLFTAADEEKKDKAKSTIIYGVIALFVMVSVWGLVNILVGTFNLDNQAQQLPELPQVPL